MIVAIFLYKHKNGSNRIKPVGPALSDSPKFYLFSFWSLLCYGSLCFCCGSLFNNSFF